MSAGRCSGHPAIEAAYRCDGCGRLLCDECIEVGHRLIFCAWCRERALPLDETGALTAPALARRRAQQTPCTRRQILEYPLRGQGGFVLWGTVAYLGALRLLTVLAPLMGFGAIGIGLIVLVLGMLLLLMMPGLSFAIVRSTAGGDDEMPDWPDWNDFSERLSECCAALVLGAMTLVPAILLVRLAGCDASTIGREPTCVALATAGLALGLPLWISGVAAVGLFAEPWLSLRWDLHARLLAITWRPTLRIAVALVGLWSAGWIAGLLLGWIPLLGSLVTLVIDVYTWFLGMHLVGLLARRDERALERVYLRPAQ